MGNSCPRCCEINHAPDVVHTRKNAYPLTNDDLEKAGHRCGCCPNSCDEERPFLHCCLGWCCAPLMLGGTDYVVTAVENYYKNPNQDTFEAVETAIKGRDGICCHIPYYSANNTAIVSTGATMGADMLTPQIGGNSDAAQGVDALFQVINGLCQCFILNGFSNAQRMRMSEKAKAENKNYHCPVTWCCPMCNVCFNSKSAYEEARKIVRNGPEGAKKMLALAKQEGDRTKKQKQAESWLPAVSEQPKAMQGDKIPLMNM